VPPKKKKQPLRMGVASQGGMRSGRTPPPHPDRDTTEEEHTILSSETLQREMQSNYRTVEGVTNSFIPYFPDRCDAMRKESDRIFEGDLKHARQIQQDAFELVHHIESRSKVSASAFSESEGRSDAGAWVSLHAHLLAQDAAGLSATDVSAFVDAPSLALFLAWVVSGPPELGYSKRARALAAQLLLRLLVATVEGAQPVEEAEAATGTVPSAAGTPTAAKAAATSPASNASPASGFGPVRVLALPSWEASLQTVTTKRYAPPLAGEIAYAMEYAPLSAATTLALSGGGAPAAEFGQDPRTKKTAERLRRLHSSLLVGRLTAPERGALRALILQFALADVDLALLEPLQSIVLFLADWDQLQASWLTYLSSLAFTLSQDTQPIRAPAVEQSCSLAFVAHSALHAFLAHLGLLHTPREKPDAHLVLLQYVIVGVLGQRFLVPGESAESLQALLVPVYGGGPFDNFNWWARSGVCRILHEAAARAEAEGAEVAYAPLVPLFGLLSAPIFSTFSNTGQNEKSLPLPFDRTADDVARLFLPLITRTVAFWSSAAGRSQAEAEAEASARPDRPLDQWERLPPVQTADEIQNKHLLPPLEAMQKLSSQPMQELETLRRDHVYKERLHKELQQRLQNGEKLGNNVLLEDPGQFVVPPELAARLDRLHAPSALLWRLLRTRFLSTAQPDPPAWFSLLGCTKVTEKASAAAAPLDQGALQTALQFHPGSHGLSNPARQALWRVMPPLTRKHEACTCRDEVAATSRAKDAKDEEEGFCAFLARLAVRARILETDGEDAARPRFDEHSTFGVRFVDSALWHEPTVAGQQPPYVAGESEIFAIENVLSFCRSSAGCCPLAAALESCALNCAMASDSLALRCIALMHCKAIPSALTHHMPSRWAQQAQPFVAAFQARCAAVATEAKACLLDANLADLPTVLADLVVDFLTPGESLCWLANVLPFLLNCLESPHAAVHDDALNILRNIPFPPLDEERQSGPSPQQALSLPTVLLRSHFDRLLSIAEAEARAEADALAKQRQQEEAAAASAAAPTPDMKASNASTILSLLVSRLNLSFPPSHAAHLPSDFLTPFIPRLAAMVLGEPSVKVLLHLMSSPLFRRAVFTDTSLLERLERLVIEPALKAAQKAQASIALQCAEGQLGRRIGATHEDSTEEEWHAMMRDQLPDPLGVGVAIRALLKQVSLLTQPSGDAQSSSSRTLSLEQLPSRAQSLLARCAAVAAEQVRCYFLWLETHERRVYFVDDPESGENYTQTSMREYAGKLVAHVQDAMACRGGTSVAESGAWLPPSLSLWPSVLQVPFRRCLETYADYEDERPREAIGTILAGLSLHAPLARKLVAPAAGKAAVYWLKASREGDGGYLVFNAITSVYWYAVTDLKSLSVDGGHALRAQLPALQRSLLVPLHPTRHPPPSDAAAFDKQLAAHVGSQGTDQSGWMSALAQALVVLRHVQASECLNVFVPSADLAAAAAVAESEHDAPEHQQQQQQQPDAMIDQVGLYVLGWLHYSFVRLPAAERNRAQVKNKRRYGVGQVPLLSASNLTLRASLLEWFAAWILSAKLQPRIHALLSDRVARAWFLQLEAARLEFPSHVRQQQPCEQWMELMRTLPSLPDMQAAAADASAASSAKDAEEAKSAPVLVPADAVGANAVTAAEKEAKVHTEKPEASALPPPAASLIPSPELLAGLQKVLAAQSSRLESSFRHPRGLPRELDAQLRHCHSLLQPQLDVLMSPAFAVPLVQAVPLARLITALSVQLERVSLEELATVPTLPVAHHSRVVRAGP
jgi:hypothetical protein